MNSLFKIIHAVFQNIDALMILDRHNAHIVELARENVDLLSNFCYLSA